MKLSDFEAVSPEDFVVFEDGMPYSYVIDRWYKTGAKEVDDFPKFYTAEQMQAFMFKNVSIALAAHELYEAEVCGFHLSQLITGIFETLWYKNWKLVSSGTWR